MAMIRLILQVLLLVSVFGAPSSSATGSRSLLREIESKDVTEDAAVDLNAANLDSVLKQRSERFAIVEFFANWCPACRHFKPHYENVARVFNGPTAAYPCLHKVMVKIIATETRGATITFLQLLAPHHPTKRCRKGSAEMLVDLDDIFPSTSIVYSNTHKKEVPEDYKICGNDVPTGHWMFCHGSRKDTRGFSCGLWVLLHSLSVRVEDVVSQFAFNATCEFIHKFFVCEECRQHFYQMWLRVPNRFTKARDFALWLWLAHNKINERLMIAEAELRTMDPKFPKVLWPPMRLCSSCSSTNTQNGTNQIVWNKEAVYMFLSHYYGKKLVSLHKEKNAPGVNTTIVHVAEETVTAPNAIVLPIRPALAIALGSCAFGALAFLGRLQLKNRKPGSK